MAKTCTVCHLEKPETEFPRRYDAPNELYRSWCKSCHYKINKERYPDKLKSAQKIWHEKNREKRNAQARINNAKWRSENPEKFSESVKKSKSKKPQKYLVMAQEKCLKRRASKKRAIPIWFNEFDELVIHEAVALCRLREKITKFKWHVDHIVPLQSKIVCGFHIGCNVQVIPGIVNQSKCNRYWPDMPC